MLGLTALVLGRQFRREQQERDFARSDWINGISHDIRTPLSMVMGYAGQLEADPVLLPRRRAQAAIIRRQSQTIRDLINDLNLTMRLDYAMQPLRRGASTPPPWCGRWRPTCSTAGWRSGTPWRWRCRRRPKPLRWRGRVPAAAGPA
ncbi:hypothetical protein M5E87_12360 [Flavonifractor plautii]|nr:hypothetical protein M5E87_12360 [Flavonifractor plautii]